MVYTHHSHPKCDTCGQKHFPGNTEACLEVLGQRCEDLEAYTEVLQDRLRDILSLCAQDYSQSQKIVDIAERAMFDPVEA